MFRILFLVAFATAASAYNPEVLSHVLTQVKDSHDAVVVFDLDDTLFNSRYRTHFILQEFILEPEILDGFHRETKFVGNMRVSDVEYSMRKTLENLGIRNEEFLGAALVFWKERFFSNEYCDIDTPISGAAKYVRDLADNGAQVVYLTGRVQSQMQGCTLKALRKNNFPVGKAARLLMKSDETMSDLAFKKAAIEEIRAMGSVVAAFENEPANINALNWAFPEAQAVFVDTIHSDKLDVPGPSVKWIKDYHQWPMPKQLDNEVISCRLNPSTNQYEEFSCLSNPEGGCEFARWTGRACTSATQVQ